MDLDKIEELARAASPGPWVDGGHTVYQSDEVANSDLICKMMSEEDSAFIAAANPAAVLDMIALVRKQEAALTGAQTRIGGMLLVQAGLVEALKEGAEYLEGVAQKTTSNAVWARCDSIAGGMRKAIAAAGVTL